MAKSRENRSSKVRHSEARVKAQRGRRGGTGQGGTKTTERTSRVHSTSISRLQTRGRKQGHPKPLTMSIPSLNQKRIRLLLVITSMDCHRPNLTRQQRSVGMRDAPLVIPGFWFGAKAIIKSNARNTPSDTHVVPSSRLDAQNTRRVDRPTHLMAPTNTHKLQRLLRRVDEEAHACTRKKESRCLFG